MKIFSFLTGVRNQDFLNWAMLTVDHKPLDYFSNEESGPDHMTHATIADDAATRAYEQLLTAEVLRGKCLEQWRELVLFTERSALKVQVVLSHLQGMVETVHMLLSDALRKMLVFSSSTLANLQYDVQMLFKVSESLYVLPWNTVTVNISKARNERESEREQTCA